MSSFRRVLGAAAAVVALLAVLPAAASASSTQEMVLQDDTYLIYSFPPQVAKALYGLKSLGVDRIRVSVVWSILAPDPNSPTRPNFDATNPTAYPAGVWDRYDVLVRLAQQAGIKVYFQLTAPAPLWATPPMALPQGFRWSHDPSATDFGQFVEAVGRHFSGSVNYWGIWNEPNIGGWMTPQWRTLRNGQKVEESPSIYRGMLDAAWHGLMASGHVGDTILLGETGASGFPWKGYGADMAPLTFVRALYCLNSSYRPLTGNQASLIGCPRSGNRAAFMAAHPELFQATGWAHHPYEFFRPPTVHMSDPNDADLSDLSRLETALARTMAAFRQHRAVPLYLTEWGYQSNPPDPFVKFSLAQQAEYLNEGEYMAWRDPHVRAFGQFLFVDAAPFTQYRTGSRAYWSSFQTGLLEVDGTVKPSYYAFRIPLWLPNPRHGRSVGVWGQFRPADHTTLQTGEIDFLPAGSKTWTRVAIVQTRNSEGFFFSHVALRSRGHLRLSWTNPSTGQLDQSRAATVT
jgi:hypothetical protein